MRRSSRTRRSPSIDPLTQRLTMQSVSQVGYYLHLMLARCLDMDDIADPRDQAVRGRRLRGARRGAELRDHQRAARPRRRRQGDDAAHPRGELPDPPRAAADRHPAQARHAAGRPHHRLRMRGRCSAAAPMPAMASSRSSMPAHCCRASTTFRRSSTTAIGSTPICRPAAPCAGTARRHAPRLRMPARPHGARARARSVRGAPRQSVCRRRPAP